MSKETAVTLGAILAIWLFEFLGLALVVGAIVFYLLSDNDRRREMRHPSDAPMPR